MPDLTLRPQHLRPSRLVHGLLSRFLGWVAGLFSDVEVVGLEHVPSRGGAVLICNHRSLFDAVALGAALDRTGRDVMVLAKAELFRARFVAAVLRRAGVIPVHRGTERAADALVAAVASLRGGELVAVFPEGTIPKDGVLLPFKSGAARMALQAGVPVIPVVLVGTDHVISSSNQRVKRTLWRRAADRADIDVVIGAPIHLPPGDGPDAVDRATETLRRAVVDLLAVHDRPPPPSHRKRDLALAGLAGVPLIGWLVRRRLRRR
ncbi:1-acyl-sn-glycerol-3-phosphate acyltransferase [Nocardioides sp. SYSU D00038]|uniref:lysophospholipid acyltransferase family protein n=1 Tax=Nocardioides sp. SYSU D00038 TaxID=2812554 RepID=UPI0019673C0F|nr:lysophospholipid acyltransferase family protein [Nocardioides sp. SYSU D00038]